MSTEVTSPSWAFSVRMHKPETESQKRTLLSLDPDTIRFPSGLNMTDEMDSEWPVNVLRTEPDSTSNKRTILSYPPVATWFCIERRESACYIAWPGLAAGFAARRAGTHAHWVPPRRVHVTRVATEGSHQPLALLLLLPVPHLDRPIS